MSYYFIVKHIPRNLYIKYLHKFLMFFSAVYHKMSDIQNYINTYALSNMGEYSHVSSNDFKGNDYAMYGFTSQEEYKEYKIRTTYRCLLFIPKAILQILGVIKWR